MNELNWHQRLLSERIRWLRYVIPPLLVVIVVGYQLGIAQTVESMFGHPVHYGMEIAFYSLTGPVVTWLMLVWVERKLVQQEQLKQQVHIFEREKASVLAEERARIARDLHDGVAQTLYFLALKADVLRQQLAANETATSASSVQATSASSVQVAATSSAQAISELREMGRSTRQIIREIRRTIFALRPLDWSETGFIEGLESFVRGFAEQTGWQTAVHLDRTLTIPSRLEPAIFRLVQESLNNVAKHAAATQVTITLAAAKPGRLQLTVQDNGQGFDPAAANGSGLGLKQMAARVTAVGGTFHVSSEAETGTQVTAMLPVNGGSHV